MAEYKSRYTGQEIDAGIGKANTALQEHQDISGKVDKVTGKGLSTNDYTTEEKEKLASIDLSEKQDTLISGENIKTINGNSILGEGNLVIEGGTGGLTSVAHDNTLTGAGTNADPLGVDASKFATSAQGDKADTAVQPEDLGDLAVKNTVDYETEVTNKPTIPSEVTESTVAGWGFTKNTGTYSKPSGGIPKTDLAEAVQTSLGKADTAIQEHQSLDNYYTKTEVDGKVSSVYRYRGTVATYANLPDSDLTVGDVYNVETDGSNYAWTGSAWDKLGGDIDLSGYQTKIDSSHKLDSDLVDDTNKTNKFVTASEKQTWNAKSDFSGSYNDLTDKPTIPDELSDLSDDSTHRLVTDTEKTTWSGKQNAIDSSHKLSADLVDDTSTTNKFVTAGDKTTWSGKQDALVSGTNIKTINNTSILGSGNISITSDEGLKEVYVNALTGSDSNDGTSWSNAKQTFASALDVASDECTLYFEGDTQERLNIKTNANQKILRIVGRDGVRNRILGGTKLVDFQTTSTTGVYKIETPSETAFSSNYYSVVQDNVIDTSTEITSYEAHPAQKGRRYRMLSTAIPRKSSVANVISSTVGFYHDGTNLYIKPASTDFTNHPIYCPTENGGIYGNDGSCLVEISNVEVWHSPLLITSCPNAKLTDCTCCFALGTGGIKYDDSVGVTLTRCEAAYVLNTSGYGDGINAHSSKYESASGDNPQAIKYVSAELIDCWCHDNSDDGWSDHSGCEVVIRGGLYEYNHKGGVTPSNGGKCTCYDVMTRKNCRGFYYVSAGSQKEKTAYFYCENCVSDGEDANRVSQGITRLAGAGFSTDDIGVSVSGWKGIYSKFVNCKSMNNDIGFGAGKKSVMTLIDCGTQTVTNRMSTLNDGVITPYSTTYISPGANVTGVTLSQTTKAVDYNQTFTLTADITPSNATNKNVTWDIPLGDTYISIVPNGLTCAVTSGSTNGNAAVRVTTEDGNYTAQCAITVAHKELSSLSYTGTLAKTSYEAGETLDLTGLTFTATYDDTSTETLNYSDLVINPNPLTEGTTSATVSYTYGSVTKSVTVSGLTVTGFISASDFDYGMIKSDGSIDTTGANLLNNVYQKTIKQFSNYKITPLVDNVIWKVAYYDAGGNFVSATGWMCRVQNQYATIASDYDITPGGYARIALANDTTVSPGTYTVAQMFARISITENS